MNTESAEQIVTPQPFLKWAGGKRRLLPALMPLLPNTMARYFEPFIGGGAMMWSMDPSLPKHINDLNPELVNLYNVVKHQVEDLIDDLSRHENDKDYFIEIRARDRNGLIEAMTPVERASRLIYLNRTCFNGLYRVNSQNQFNAPFGYYKNPKIVNEANLRVCSSHLQSVVVTLGDFEQCALLAEKDDFVYLDPPYVPVSETANFVGYTAEGFDTSMHERIKTLTDTLTDKGVKVMQSNAHHPVLLDLYADYRVHTIEAPRAINCKGDKRGSVKELVIVNY